ncbi:unnamed protein product, partial [Laminaria digitata]
MAACSCVDACVETVRLLLEAGADPTLATAGGFTPMHVITQRGHTELVGMLHSNSPDTINTPNPRGETPLFMACCHGHASVVSRLLSLGAIRPEDHNLCPLAIAVRKGFLGVVRVLVNEGMEAVGVKKALHDALYISARFCQGRILRLLLGVGGEKRFALAYSGYAGKRLIHIGAGVCCPAVVSVLLNAGARETERDLKEGRVPRDFIGVDDGLDDGDCQIDRGKEIAVRRMLERGPAYRARSWVWPYGDEEADAGVGGDRDPTGGGG